MDTPIMKSLLEAYLDKVEMTSDQLAEIEGYIFCNSEKFRHVHSPEVLDTALYLKEIAEENGFITSAQLYEFFKSRKKKYNKFLWELMDEDPADDHSTATIEWENIASEVPPCSLSSNMVIYPNLNGYNVNSYVKTLSRYFKHIYRSVLDRISEYQVITMHLDASALSRPSIFNTTTLTTKCKLARYFEAFSSKENNNVLLAWTHTATPNYILAEGSRPIEFAKLKSDLFLSHTEPGRSSQEGIAKVLDNIVAHVSKERPIHDKSIKEELVEWFLYSKMHTTEAEPIGCAYEQLNKASTSPERLSPQTRFENVNFQKAYYKTMLIQKQWKILKSPPGLTWLASDNPGFGINLVDLYNRPTEMVADGSLTNIRQDTLIYYPISSDYCLRIQPYNGDTQKRDFPIQTAIEFEQSTLEELEVVNGLTFSTKKEMVVGRDKKSFQQLESI